MPLLSSKRWLCNKLTVCADNNDPWHNCAMTAPASTDANWSLSPSKIKRAVKGTACNTRAIISRSIIEASSITTTSAVWPAACSAFNANNQRCKVCACPGKALA